MAAPRKLGKPDPAFGQLPPARAKPRFPQLGGIEGADPSILATDAAQAGILVHGPTLDATRPTHYGAHNHRKGEQGQQRGDR